MKVIIAGSCSVKDMVLVSQAIRDSGFDITEVVSGGASDVDRIGEFWAAVNGIPVVKFIPDWEGYAGKRAGFIRNAKMADYADALVCVWDGRSRGTKHLLNTARARGLKIYVLGEPVLKEELPPPTEPIDYRHLLKNYIVHVSDTLGSTFLGHGYDSRGITPAEWGELRILAEEAIISTGDTPIG